MGDTVATGEVEGLAWWLINVNGDLISLKVEREEAAGAMVVVANSRGSNLWKVMDKWI